MIKYKLNSGNRPIDESGKLIDTTNKHLLVLEDYALLFDTIDEKQAYIDSIPKQWNKEIYSSTMNEAHNALFRKYYTERNYLSIGEISVWVDDADFGTEANALIAWWQTTCKLVAAHLDTVTEESAVSVDEFLNQLPEL